MQQYSLPWQSSKFPFSTNIRTWTQNCKEILFFCNLQECFNVQEGRHVLTTISKIKDSIIGFMKIPWHVSEHNENTGHYKGRINICAIFLARKPPKTLILMTFFCKNPSIRPLIIPLYIRRPHHPSPFTIHDFGRVQWCFPHPPPPYPHHPSNLRFYCNESRCSKLPKAVPPILGVDSKVMDGSAMKRDYLLVQCEVYFTRFQALRNTPCSVVLVHTGIC